jgi:hypothetical protein
MRRTLAFVLYLSALTAIAQRFQPTPLVDLDAPYIPVHTDSHPCVDSDLEFLSKSTTTNLLADYGFNLAPPYTCVAAVVPWLPSARIIRVHESLGLDNYRTVTLAQGSPSARVWVIPIELGMVSYPNTVDNPHHIAAFNDLLQFASRKPDKNLLFELGNLYQFMLGMEEWFDPTHAPKTIRDALKINDVMGMMADDAKGITLKHREPNGDSWTHTYMVWEFYFERSKGGLRLSNVERRPLDPETDDIKRNEPL